MIQVPWVVAKHFRRWAELVSGILFAAVHVACSAPRETPQVEVRVVVDSTGLESVTTNLGYEVAFDHVDLAIRDLEFTVAGELHSSIWRELSEVLVPSAWAHPGHYQGGDITGELPGEFLLHFLADEAEELGTATLLVGDYHSANFFFRRDDELDGHTCLIKGVAWKDEEEVLFTIALDSPEDRQLVGAPFEERVEEDAPLVVGLRLLALDPTSGETLLDDVDFFTLEADVDGHVGIGPGSEEGGTADAYNRIHRRFQAHDYFEMRTQD